MISDTILAIIKAYILNTSNKHIHNRNLIIKLIIGYLIVSLTLKRPTTSVDIIVEGIFISIITLYNIMTLSFFANSSSIQISNK